MVGEGFTLVAADTHQARSVVMMKDNLDKMVKISSKSILLLAGEGKLSDC